MILFSSVPIGTRAQEKGYTRAQEKCDRNTIERSFERKIFYRKGIKCVVGPQQKKNTFCKEKNYYYRKKMRGGIFP